MDVSLLTSSITCASIARQLFLTGIRSRDLTERRLWPRPRFALSSIGFVNEQKPMRIKTSRSMATAIPLCRPIMDFDTSAIQW